MAAPSKALEKARATLAKGRARAKEMFGNVQPYAKAGAGGFGAYYLTAWAGDQFDFVKTSVYGGPVLMLGGGVLAGRRGYTDVGKGLAGAAGYALAFNMEIQKFQEGKRNTSPVPDFRKAATTTTTSTKGYDTGDATTSTPGMDPFVEPGAADTGWADDDDASAVAELRDAAAVAELRDAGEDDYDVSSALNIGGGVGNEWAF